MNQDRSTQRLQVRELVGLSIIPAALFISSIVMTAVRGPNYYLAHNFDPEYAYLLNSLNILLGASPGHTDHPGTSVQLLGAVIIGGQYGLARLFGVAESSLETAVLNHPESYLRTINLFFNLLLTGGCYLVGYRGFRQAGRWLFPVVLQIVPFLFKTTLMATARVMPEPFLLFINYYLVFFLLPFIINQTYRLRKKKESIFLGAILGLGMATKVTFVPLLLLLWLPDTFKRKCYAFMSMIITFLLVTLPIWSKYVDMARWLIRLAVHNGRYGRGEVGLGSPDELGQNLAGLVVSEPSYFMLIGVVLFGGAILFWHRHKIKNEVVRSHYLLMLTLFITILLVQTALIVKHPPVHYALPSMGMADLMLLLLVSAPIALSERANRLIQYGLLIFLVGALGITAFKVKAQFHVNRDFIDSVQYLDTLVAESYSHCSVAYYYRSSTVSQALDFGNKFADRHYGRALNQMYPTTLFYSIWGQRFHTFTTFFDAAEMDARLNNGECILMQGTPFSNGYEKYASSIIIERLDESSSDESLYRLIGFNPD